MLLPSELQELLLTYAIRKIKLDCLWEPEPILQVLNVVSRKDMPNLTKQVLWDFAWIDMDVASCIGDMGLLDFLLQWSKLPQGRPLQYSSRAITYASAKGFVHVLDWWFSESGVLICWNEEALDQASENGHIAVLDWWLKSGMLIKYTEKAMDSASANGHVAVLAWWLKYIPTVKYSDKALYDAAQHNHLDVLHWWEKSGLPLKASQLAIGALKGGHDRIIEWVVRIGRTNGTVKGWDKVVEDCDALIACIASGRPSVLVWFDSLSLLSPTFVTRTDVYSKLFEAVVASGSISVLEWLRCKQLLRCGPRIGMGIAAAYGHIHVLEYLHSAMHLDDNVRKEVGPLREFFLAYCSPYVRATKGGHVHVLDWLVAHGYQFPSSDDINLLSLAAQTGNVALVKWWCDHPRHACRDIGTAVGLASACGNMAQLAFFEAKGWISANIVVENNHEIVFRWPPAVLEWWYHRFPQAFRGLHWTINYPWYGDFLAVVNWWLDKGLQWSVDPTVSLCETATNSGQLGLLAWGYRQQIFHTPISDDTILICYSHLRRACLGFHWWMEQPACRRVATKGQIKDWPTQIKDWPTPSPNLLLASLERKGMYCRETIEWTVSEEGSETLALASLFHAGDIASLSCILRLDLAFSLCDPDFDEPLRFADLAEMRDDVLKLLLFASDMGHLPLLEWWLASLPQHMYLSSWKLVFENTSWHDSIRHWWLKLHERFPRFPIVEDSSR